MEKTMQIEVARKPKYPALIVEDTKENQELLEDLCSELGISTVVAENGQVALNLLNEKNFSIYIVDLRMPVMDGRMFIHFLKKKHPDSIIIVQTALNDSDTIIEVMRHGVFDYIVKPIDPDLFRAIISRAIEYKYMKDMELYQSLNAGKKIKNQIDWLIYKENRRVVAKDYYEIKSIYNIKSYMTQGAGMGSIIVLLDILKSTLESKGDTYIVNKDILDVILENNNYLRMQVEGLTAITNILDNEFELQPTDSVALSQAIPQMVSEIDPYLSKKNIRLTYPEVMRKIDLHLNMEKVTLAIEELVINAYKYSVHGGIINIFTQISDNYFWISVKNDVDKMGIIPPESEKLVIEPFYRILPPDESVAAIEKFGLGLGLTVVDNIVRKHNGIFLIKTVKDHTADVIRDCVLAEILLPIM